MTGAMGRLFGATIVAAMAVGCIVEVGGGESQWTFDAPETLEASVGNGDIRVSTSRSDRLFARWEGGGLGNNASPDVAELVDGTVVIDANGLAGGGTLEIETPDDTDLGLLVDRGSIDVYLDAPTNVFACAGAGRVAIDVPPGPYRLEVGALVGVIDNAIVDDPNAPYTIEVCVGAGEVELRTH
ncbi:MAG: hypothetical protein AAGA48_09650 [Myxococcota bacterium]